MFRILLVLLLTGAFASTALAQADWGAGGGWDAPKKSAPKKNSHGQDDQVGRESGDAGCCGCFSPDG